MKKNRIARLVSLLSALLLLTSCAVDPTFVRAARETHDAVAPEYLQYVDADPALSQDAKDRRHRTIERWVESIAVREVKQ